MVDLENISAFVFLRLCHEVGTSSEVGARRDVVDLKNTLANKARINHDNVFMTSGSRREGFRMMDSDVDVMCWPDNYRVIWDVHQSQCYNIHMKELILCDCSESPPGFTLLYLLSPRLYSEIHGACVRMKNRHYISSSKHREMMCFAEPQSSTLHGPCVSRFHGILGYDFAHCLASDIWPPSASSWIDRSNSWPQYHIVHDIVKSGCHFVAVGHKLGRHEHNEWRISFSLAEQKLVYAMNHCQFLTYGLLKLFLNRIINNGLGDDDKLLCSYHIKTAVFWVIQQNMIPYWCPHTVLYSSWVCFKLILKWVYEGVCPNFFIPSNNMFLSNIYGEAQNVLFIRLYELYKIGIRSMLDTLSIMSCSGCIAFLRDPSFSRCADENIKFSEADFDVKLFKEIESNDSLPALNVQGCLNYLQYNILERTITTPLTQYQVGVLQTFTNSVLQNLAFVLHMNTYSQENKLKYRADKKSCHILKLAAKFGCISDMLYIAMYYYTTLRYKEALYIIEVTKIKLAKSYVMHNYSVDGERYTEAVGGQSWSTKMRHAVAWDLKLNNKIIYISELIPEQHSSQQNNVPFLYVPPFVMLYMLEVFCYQHIDTIKAQEALDDLRTLIHYDQGQFITVLAKNTAWQILGICQQMTRNFQDAMFSYQQSLREDQLHSIQTATEMRIQGIRLLNYYSS
ncbi:uncharacterized protein LOC133197922 [Saccostrea echinata]|uniref:uncharacterized protein LOC133197922 n=1 Tax=Saccostrea echinata TaxID=191078 RepID=UPI002A8163CE|nr:uncharacterized protein LOC133197922 [Saccostrea echinata]